MIEKDWSGDHIRKQVGGVGRMLKWATENEMIFGTVYESRRCTAGLKRGRTKARDEQKVKPVSDADMR